MDIRMQMYRAFQRIVRFRSRLRSLALSCAGLRSFALVCVPLLCVAQSTRETKITKCQSEAMQIMYGACTEQVRSMYGASPNLSV